MNRKRTSIDGFVTRRPQRSDLGERTWQKTETTIGHERTDLRKNTELDMARGLESREISDARGSSAGGQVKSDISQSLSAIDQDSKADKKKRKIRSKKRRVVKRTIIAIALLLLLIGGVLLYRAWMSGGRVFNGDMLGLFQQQQLKMDKHGRSNVVIVGTTDDDPTRKDEGDGILTDSMMVISIDQNKKDAYMFSIPRDLYVKYNQACLTGYAGKINVYFGCIDDKDSKQAEDKRLEGIRKFVGDIFDMEIQYAVHVKSNVVRDAVNAVGGVTVEVQSNDPRGVLDASLDWMCTQNNPTAAERQKRCPTGHYIDFPNGPNNMDGDKAMWFSRARGAIEGMPTYGLAESNFDREKNQQLVIMALLKKASSVGVLADLGKVMKLVDAMGDNLRTDIDPKYFQTIMKLASEIKESEIKRLSFVEEGDRLMVTGAIGGGSIVQPAAGLYNYSAIRSFLKKTIFASPLTKEGATAIVLNGGGMTGAAQTEADKLAEAGITVASVGNAEADIAKKIEIYQMDASQLSNPATRSKLEEIYGVKVMAGKPPFGLPATADFVVVIGPAEA